MTAAGDVGPTAEPAGVRRFREELERRGGTARVELLPDSVHTAALAAQALGCPVGAIANSLLFEADRRPVLLLVSGAHRVDTVATAAALGVGELRRAAPDVVRSATGQVIGGVSPLGHPAPIPTWIDVRLRQYDAVWAAAGHPAAVFATSFDELVRLTGAAVLDTG